MLARAGQHGHAVAAQQPAGLVRDRRRRQPQVELLMDQRRVFDEGSQFALVGLQLAEQPAAVELLGNVAGRADQPQIALFDRAASVGPLKDLDDVSRRAVGSDRTEDRQPGRSIGVLGVAKGRRHEPRLAGCRDRLRQPLMPAQLRGVSGERLIEVQLALDVRPPASADAPNDAARRCQHARQTLQQPTVKLARRQVALGESWASSSRADSISCQASAGSKVVERW